MRKIRIFLAEDQTILRQSLKALIANEPDLEVVGEAGDGADAVKKFRSCCPKSW